MKLSISDSKAKQFELIITKKFSNGHELLKTISRKISLQHIKVRGLHLLFWNQSMTHGHDQNI
jgi:hypothetical protein